MAIARGRNALSDVDQFSIRRKISTYKVNVFGKRHYSRCSTGLINQFDRGTIPAVDQQQKLTFLCIANDSKTADGLGTRALRMKNNLSLKHSNRDRSQEFCDTLSETIVNASNLKEAVKYDSYVRRNST
jgi:hypothetical protein